jgi:hypothetical protein
MKPVSPSMAKYRLRLYPHEPLKRTPVSNSNFEPPVGPKNSLNFTSSAKAAPISPLK